MLQGFLHHGTDAEIEANVTDTHGASIIGSGSANCSASACYPGSSGSVRSASTAPGCPATPSGRRSRP